MIKSANKAESQNKYLQENVKEYKSFFDKLSKEKAQFEEQAHNLEEENSEIMTEMKRLTSSLSQVKEENARMKNDVSEWIKKLENYKKFKSADQENISELENLNFEQKTKISGLTSELEILKHYIENQTHRNSEVFL